MWIHVRHFGCLHGVVPDLSGVEGNLVRTRMSLILWSRLYAIRGRDGKMSAVSSSSVRRLKLLYNMCLTCWLIGWKVRVIGMCSLVFCLFAGSKVASCVSCLCYAPLDSIKRKTLEKLIIFKLGTIIPTGLNEQFSYL